MDQVTAGTLADRALQPSAEFTTRSILNTSGWIKDPIALNRPRPNYTEEARKKKIQGVILARALVGADGSVRQVVIRRGLPGGLDGEAILAVSQMRFRPAMRNGQPVATWITLEVEFNLR